MAKLFISGVAARAAATDAPAVRPTSVLELFGRPPVEGCYSGLYGTSSTREGLKRLLQSAQQPMSIFRIVCEVPGDIVTSMGSGDLQALGYVNVRYADAPLLARIEDGWRSLSALDDAREAIQTRPDLAAQVLSGIGVEGLSVIIHPFRPPDTNLVLNVATVLDQRCVIDVHSRDPNLRLAWP